MGGEKEAHAKTWFETDTVNAWRHQRMYKLLDPIIDADKNAQWLTVGDGRYGKDGNYIQQRGCDVLVTDLYLVVKGIYFYFVFVYPFFHLRLSGFSG